MTMVEGMSPQIASSLVVTGKGGSEVLEVLDREVEDPEPGQLLVAVEAAGVNFMDVYQREGVYPTPTPFVLGAEGAGTVVAVTDTGSVSAADSFAVGDRVAWAAGSTGSASSLAIVTSASAVRVPDGVSLRTAAAVMLQGMTAHYLINSTYNLRAGEWALIHAAAGGVGQLAIQLAKAKGATVIGTASTAEKVAKARAAGADHVINYRDVDDVAGEVRRLTDGRGVAVVYDGVGQSTFDASLASLRPRGMLVLFGGSSGQVPPFDLQRLNRAGSLYITRPTLGHYISTREELLERAGSILDSIAHGRLRVEIGGEYPLAEAKRAYEDLEGRKTSGKLLLLPT